MRRLAFIPARGGSKGIKRKNLQLVGGRSLIERTFDAANKSCVFDEVFLSTDDEEILAEGRKCGFVWDYKRPKDLACDSANPCDALLHCLNWLETRGESFSIYALLQPTSPLRTAEDIKISITNFEKSQKKTLVSVNKVSEHPNEMIVIKGNSLRPLIGSDFRHANRQSYSDKIHFINGAIYAGYVDVFRNEKKFFDITSVHLHEMPKERSVDVDEMHELVVANALCRMQERIE